MAYAGLFAGAWPQDMLLNGQYILLRRAVHQASGGFASVRGEALEDVALGTRLRHLGYNVPMMLGEEAASWGGYENTAQLWHGMNRIMGRSRCAGRASALGPPYLLLH